MVYEQSVQGCLFEDSKEAAPSPPNHGGDEFLTCPRQAAIVGQDWASALAVVSEGPCLCGKAVMIASPPQLCMREGVSLTECVRE